MMFRVVNPYRLYTLDFLDSEGNLFKVERIEDDLEQDALFLCLKEKNSSSEIQISLRDIANDGHGWRIKDQKVRVFLDKEVNKPLKRWIKRHSTRTHNQKRPNPFFEQHDDPPEWLNPYIVISSNKKEVLNALEMLEKDQRYWKTEPTTIWSKVLDLVIGSFEEAKEGIATVLGTMGHHIQDVLLFPGRILNLFREKLGNRFLSMRKIRQARVHEIPSTFLRTLRAIFMCFLVFLIIIFLAIEFFPPIFREYKEKEHEQTTQSINRLLILPSPPSGRFTIQVSSTSTINGAKQLIERLRSRGEDVYCVRVIEGNNTILYKIRLGRFERIQDARNHANVLIENNTINDFFITNFQVSNDSCF